ncbi:MAG: major facilitator superfamily 1 [Eubacterium sp.]|nr:major facilitator superfamily 1 [Eubacterium sp.]
MAKQKIYVLYLVTSLFWFSSYIYSPILPTYIKSLGASYLMVGLILGCYGVGQLVLRVPIGIISDRLRKRRIFINMGLLSLVISSLGLYLFREPVLILIFRSLSGVASAFWVIFTVLYSSYFDESQATKAVGILNAFCNGGILLGLLSGGFIVRSLGVTATFFVSLVVATIGFVISFSISEKQIDRKPAEVKELLMVVRDGNFQTVAIIGVICQFVSFATVYGFTPVVAKNLGASDFQIAMLTALSTVPAVIGSALSGSYFAGKFGEKKTMIYGLVIAALACCAIPYSHNMAVLSISQFLGGFGTGTVFPLLMGLSIKNVSSDKRATAMGIFQAIYGLGMFMGPTVVGALTDGVGIKWGFITIGAVALSGILVSMFYKQEKVAVKRSINV